MNNKPNIPEEMARSWEAGGHWLMVVFVTDIPGAYSTVASNEEQVA
jgi:hypothetical protein